MPPSHLAPSVGGMLELHYAQPTFGPVYPLRVAVTCFDLTPSGSGHDYLYTAAGGFTPGETGVRATFNALAALWALYYDVDWSIELAAVYRNDGGVPALLPVTPSTAAVAGAADTALDTFSRAKRSIALISRAGSRWRVWLRQLLPAGVGETVLTSSSTGGIDDRDRAWYEYAASDACAVVGRDGQRLQGGGEVRAWWDTPPAPYVVTG